MNEKHKIEFDRFMKRNRKDYSKKVINYGENLVNRVEENSTLGSFFENNFIGIYTFLRESLSMSELKYRSIGNEKLDEEEINQVFGTIILQNELLKLQLKNRVFIKGLNEFNDFIYELSDKAQTYFQDKYGVKLGKEISVRDIIIVSPDNDSGIDIDDEEELF
jgi:hypothetical protein